MCNNGQRDGEIDECTVTETIDESMAEQFEASNPQFSSSKMRRGTNNDNSHSHPRENTYVQSPKRVYTNDEPPKNIKV